MLTGIDRWKFANKLPVDIPVPCPSITIMEDLRYFYELPKTNNPEERISFSEAKIESARGECVLDSSKQLLTLKLNIEVTANPGPFTQFMELKAVPLHTTYFVAVSDQKNEILTKERFNLNISFLKDKTDPTTKVMETLTQNINIENQHDYTDYSILIGFQLSDTQLKYVRTILNTKNSSPVPDADPLLLH